MKTIIVSSLAIFFLFNVNIANACSYKVDNAKKSVELKQVALASLGDSKVLSSSISDFSYIESKPTLDCPEELTYTAIVTVSYKHGMNTCTAELAVKKVEAQGEADLDIYSVTGRKSARCKK